MADRMETGAHNGPTADRQGVREPQPIEGTSAARDLEGSELASRREFGAADLARENESRQAAPGPAAARQPSLRGSASRHEHGGVIGRVRDAWDRMRHRV